MLTYRLAVTGSTSLTAGRMKPKGQAQIDRAKAEGCWAAAYAPQSQASPDHDLEAALDAEPSARTLFDTLDAANQGAVLYRVHQAKTPEKRAAKIAEMVAKLARGETFHPRRGQTPWQLRCLAAGGEYRGA